MHPSIAEYQKCLSLKERELTGQLKSKQVVKPLNCNKAIDKFCPNYFSKPTSKLHVCYNHFHVATNSSFSNLAEFQQHDKCMKMAETIFHKCKNILTKSCKSHNVRSFKTIRMNMDEVQSLIEKEPTLKIVHLVRDPRGVVNSRVGSGSKYISEEAKLLCSQMLINILECQKLKEKYPNNIFQVRYEDIAAAPIEQAQVIYNFTRNSPLPESVLSFLNKSMNSDINSGQMGTSRKNSTATAYMWRQKLSVTDQNVITNHCSSVLDKLNYKM